MMVTEVQPQEGFSGRRWLVGSEEGSRVYVVDRWVQTVVKKKYCIRCDSTACEHTAAVHEVVEASEGQ